MGAALAGSAAAASAARTSSTIRVEAATGQARRVSRATRTGRHAVKIVNRGWTCDATIGSTHIHERLSGSRRPRRRAGRACRRLACCPARAEGHPARAGRSGGWPGRLLEVAGQRVDHGSHRLHPSTPPRLIADLRSMLGPDLQTRPRNGRLRIEGRWIGFPLQAGELTRELLPPWSRRWPENR